MKVTVCCHKDFARYGYLASKAMRTAGINSRSFALKPHEFHYPEQADIVSKEKIRRECSDSDVIVVMHSCGTMETIVKEFSGKKPIVVFHTGTRYRVNRNKYDDLWRPHATMVVAALAEFMTQEKEYMGITVDDTELLPDYSYRHHSFGHYPSNSVVKGTETIRRACNIAEVKLNSDSRVVDYLRNLYRMKTVDCYIELFAPDNRGQIYGSFGTQAVEAAALGKVVITQNLHTDVYWKHYMPMDGVAFVHDFHDLVQAIGEVRDMTAEQLLHQKKACRAWVEMNHGLEASGRKLLHLMEKAING